MQGGKKLIFMVDDDRVILNLLEYIFQGKNGYLVKTFLSGEACVEKMDMEPDLVVLDYILNVNDKKAMNGLETMKVLLKINNDLPVIILSAFTDAQTGEDMMKNGALAVLRKDDYFVDRLEKYIVNELE